VATRLVWSGARIASLVDGRVRVHEADGAVLVEPPFERPVLDLDVDARGGVLTFDDTGGLRRWLPHAHGRTQLPLRPTSVSLAARRRLLVADAAGARPSVHTLDGRHVWTFSFADHALHASGARSAVLAPDGAALAISYATLPGDPRPPGRGWIVLAVDATKPGEQVAFKELDRHWLQTSAEPGPTLFAFDARAARMIHASPETTPHVGAIRIGKQRKDPARYTTAHPGGAHAIALDPRGIIAAYAYPDAPRRVRVDYLDPADAELSMIEVLETLTIDPALPDVAALAFSPDSHAIACLSRSGAIEIVPVP